MRALQSFPCKQTIVSHWFPGLEFQKCSSASRLYCTRSSFLSSACAATGGSRNTRRPLAPASPKSNSKALLLNAESVASFKAVGRDPAKKAPKEPFQDRFSRLLLNEERYQVDTYFAIQKTPERRSRIIVTMLENRWELRSDVRTRIISFPNGDLLLMRLLIRNSSSVLRLLYI